MSGAIYPFLDDLNETLHPHFAGTKYEQLFVGNFVDRVHTFDLSQWTSSVWNPAGLLRSDEDHRIYCVLGYHMALIDELMTHSNTTNDISYFLAMYMDKHIPLMIHMEDVSKYTNEYLLTDYGEGAPIQLYEPSEDFIFHQGLIPNVINFIPECSFWSDIRSKTNPIVHVLSKGLPQRCQIRNMREILNKYSRKHEAVYNFIFACLKCSLLGMYKSCTVRPPLKIRIRLYRKIKSMSKAEFLQWMLGDHQQLLFYIIKEFLIFGVQDVPSIYAEIERRYYWDKFVQCVNKAMNTVRSNIEDSSNIMNFRGIEEQLITINKQQVHHLFRPTRHVFCNVIMNECERIDDINFVDYIRDKTTSENRELMYQMAIRVPLTNKTEFDWLKYFNVSEEVAKKMNRIQETYILDGTKGPLKNFLNSLPRYDFECVRDLCAAFDRKFNIRIFTLPCHTYINQCKAIRRKHSIPNGEKIPDTAADTFVCLECKKFKGFITKRERGKIVNLFAFGHSKVLIDDETMQFYCGKRSDKVDSKKRNQMIPEYSSFIDVDMKEIIRANNIRNRKRMAKEERKKLRNLVCSKTPLVTINMLGVVLQFYNNLYMVCQVCANFMSVTSEYYTKHGSYCGCCLQHGKLYTSVSCEWCKVKKSNESWSPITVKDNGEEKSIYLCNNCNKVWIRNAETILTLDTIKKGLEQRWKRLQHPGL